MSVLRSGSASRFLTLSRRILATFFAVCLLLAACGSDEPETVAQAEESLAPAASPEPAASTGDGADVVDATDGDADDADEPVATPAANDADTASDSDDASDDDANDDSSGDDSGSEGRKGLDKETIGDRGLRLPGEERPEDDAPNPVEPTVAPAAAVEPTATPEPETVSAEPAPTPAPTPTPPPQNDPVGQPPAQLPQGPVPSDDLEIPGPPTDDGSDIEIISDAGILACATTEAAIEFLDRGDLTRTEEALQSAGALASSASESAIAALASQLSGAGRDSDASFEAIVAMLSACAQYGYEV